MTPWPADTGRWFCPPLPSSCTHPGARGAPGPRVVTLARTDGFPYCPDIVVNSTHWADMQEVAAFEVSVA
jgi:hypothetical protein